MTTTTSKVDVHENPHQLQKLQKLDPHDCLIVVAAKTGQDVQLSMVPRPQGLRNVLELKLEAHRRWNTSVFVSFLSSVDRIEISKTRTNGHDQTVYYTLDVFLCLPTSRLPTSSCNLIHAPSSRHKHVRRTFSVERRFDEFEELRKNVLEAVSQIPQCTCQYCLDFLVYIHYKYKQPRSIMRLTSGLKKRRRILTRFINDFVAMSQRQMTKSFVVKEITV
ncbi:Phox homologous domain [Plasmopara halstedii]|uniref:Phox homologous domain n=1 Tax=Plasmopara halstedii TaxID=4781 RepID=A0A0P1AH71_PLAHL|nr:Phox homologous domain [Plasmopara halstedii]CEG40018.1 Phox homologous domain [Plasmopara halstedii]|eukprot:XP_024576387.1 Phox homologous domain [Plasmopara halstedii]